MIAVGLDIGGTKIEAQVFDADWGLVDQRRVASPKSYEGLLAAICDLIVWASGTKPHVPVGIGMAGLIAPDSGLALTANLPATGKPFLRDIERGAARRVWVVNDCNALALSEAVFGAGKSASPVAGLILGTGVGGGVAINGTLMSGPAGVGGEFGHIAASAHLVRRYNLPIVTCGCGRQGCIETLISGPGISRLAISLCGQDIAPEDIGAARHSDPQLADVWQVWCELVAQLMLTISVTVDPEVIVIGGGLSRIKGVVGDLSAALAAIQFDGFKKPVIRVVQGGDASGARGAAYFAWLQATDG